MAYSQIRINKTAKIQEILEFLKKKFYGMSEAEIIKMSLSNMFRNFKEDLTMNGFTKEEEKEILEISEKAKKGIDVSEPMEADEFLDHLKSMMK